MAVSNTTYYGAYRVREMSPDAQDWAVTDSNWELITLLLKAFENHHHDASAALTRPGYFVAPAAPTVVPTGIVGTTSYTYQVIARGTIHQQFPVASTTTGNATLTSSNYNRITWAAVTGATGYDVLRLVGGVTQGIIVSNVTTLTANDTGLVASAYTPVTLPSFAEISTGGALTPGTSVIARLSYVNALGLETDASPEASYTVSNSALRPPAPTVGSVQAAVGALGGGTYIYAMTKRKDSGETEISDVATATVGYDTTYSVTLSFNPISTYTDGTNGLSIYRANGLNSPFQLLTTITASTTNVFVDTNTIASGNQNVRPPTTSSFDATNKVRITWSALSFPAAASKLRVYITQQQGMWGTNCLLTEIDLTASPATYIDYLGTETLQRGSPPNASSIPAGSPKINLATETIGAPVLTANMNFAGFQAQNLKLHNNAGAPATPTNGYIYYDTSTNNIRAYINGGWVNWGVTVGTGYTHPVEESGGHTASSIRFVSGTSTNNVGTILGRLVDSAGNPKSVQTTAMATTVTLGNPSTVVTTSSTAYVPDMVVNITPTWAGQKIKIDFSSTFLLVEGATLSLALEINGTTVATRSLGIWLPTSAVYMTGTIPYLYTSTSATTHTIKIGWWVTTGTAMALDNERELVAQLVF